MLLDGHGEYSTDTTGMGTDSDVSVLILAQACGLSEAQYSTARVLDVGWSHPEGGEVRVGATVGGADTVIALAEYSSCNALQQGLIQCDTQEGGATAQLTSDSSGGTLFRLGIFELTKPAAVELTFESSSEP